MKRGHELNGPWRLSCTLLLSAVVVSPDQNRSMLAEEFNISCRYAGVFHVEKNRRYSLTRDEAVELCKALNSTLPTMDQMKNAHSLGFETCRYGFIEDKIVIPRIKPYSLCAANNTGIYILVSNITDRYDTYCYNASETREKACEPITRLDVSGHDNTSQIVIDNEDGSRYTDGVKHTDPTPVTDDNHVSSGSIHDGDATNPNIIGTRMPGTPYYEEITPDAPSTDYSSGSGRKEDHPTSTNDIATPFDDKRGEDSTMISLITDGVPGKDHPSKGQHPTSTTIITADEDSLRGAHHENSTQSQHIPGFIPLQRHSTDHKEEHPTAVMKAYEDSHHGNSTQGQQMPGFIPSSADHKEEHPSTAGQADEDSQENITRGEDSRQSHLNRGSLPEGDNNEAKEGHPTSTSVKPIHEETSTQPQWNQFADSWWWWSHPDHKEQQPTQATGAVNPHHGAHEETSTQHEGNPSPDIWWGSTTDHKEQHRTTATKDKDSQEYETDDEDLLQDPLHSGWDTNDDMEQHPPVTTVVVSNEGAKNEDTTQDPLLHNVYFGVEKDEDKYPTNTTVDSVKPAHFPAKERDHSSSSMTVNNEIGRNTYTPTVVVSTEGDKNEDPTQDPLLNGAHLGWSDKVKYSTNTTRDDVLLGVIPSRGSEHSTTAMVSSGGTKHEDSTQDPLLHTVHPGWGNADKYPTNVTRDDVLTGIIPPSEKDQEKESSHTAVTSNDGAIYEDSIHDSLPPDNQPGWGSEDKYPTNTSRDYVIPGLIPENEDESYTAVVVSNEGAKNEDTTQDPLLHNVYFGVEKDEDKYPTNTTVDSVKPAHFPAKERDHSSSSMTVNNEIGRNTYTPTVVISTEGGKNEDPTQDPLLNGAHLGWSDKVKYSTNTTREDVLLGVIPSRGSEHSTTAMVSSGGTKHEDSTQDPLLHTVHPGWGNADKYPTNVTRDDVLTGIIPPSEKDQEKESSHTAVTSNDGAIYEDSIHDSLPPDNQPGWGSEDKYPTNTSRDYVIPGLIPENEDESYTAVVSNDGATHEDSTQDPLLHSVHPGWGNEDKYLTAISRDDELPGIIPPSETEHKNESSHTAVVSNDGIKHEDSTKDPLAPGIQPGGDNEDKYPTNNPIDNLIPGVFSDIEIGHGRGPASTATSSTLNKHDGRRANPSGQVTTPKTASQPRSAQIPEWLIIVASLLALTLILAVCIAVNSRSRCGQKKKLVINNGKGSVSDKKMGGLNGEASKSQEMVHLVNKQQPDNRTGPCDEFLTTDETKNQQEANMKTGL
ncbi:CD44 antigen isoform X6 [Malaclemys terrapin pileata]|uniref:CD44 antigen isoform X6 n=1 Tax=Malaclemys terrapin pileata TaxID=2991368 RepID=UPI0023A86CC9|nr:CD44 antigen isoform X6 [Malaclemys terrapin pileata]